MLFLLYSIISWLINVYSMVVLIRTIIDWVLVLMPRWRPGPTLGSIFNVFYVLTDPPLRWLRRYIPIVRIGAMGIDFSPVVLILGLEVLNFLL